MTIKINAVVRAAIRQILAHSRDYDPATMRIGRAADVSAHKDPDKTSADDGVRYLVGYAHDMVRQDGSIREGW